ncbi:JAB domain-containing protein [Lactobacillus sp.]|uniref:JAB domain-containing protein n=1 Tax=Lactobacillus sp. TaxID=1591 RepID=UPI0019BCDF70|nr:JAB domain-containing protein [Lactobacillus sp.]MBD5430484.1 JAB domain-containing protein [Lactobacillus sp.]MBD5430778.1 JAB domain-containing protein [Lactobacillus sp.]
MTYSTKIDKIKISNNLSAKELLTKLENNSLPQDLTNLIVSTLKRNTLLNTNKNIPFNSSTQLGYYLASKYGNLEQEEVHGLYLDSELKLISDVLLAKGSLNKSYIHPRDIFRKALQLNCASFVLVHNHPSNNVHPSDQDIKLINRVKEASQFLCIPLLDNFVITKNNYFSFAEEKLI